MSDYVCANLVDVKEGKILLVKVRTNALYYLPGGKIEEGEDDRTSLQRELYEELKVELDKEKMSYLYTVTGPAYPNTDKIVELRCYAYKGNINNIEMNNEITDVEYIDIKETHRMAPAVKGLIGERMKG